MCRVSVLAVALLWHAAALAAAGQAAPGPAASGEPSGQEQREDALEVFQAPARKDMKVPYYPRSRRQDGSEGWVQLHFMIDPEGQPYEIVVTDSTGDNAFEESAVRAVERSTFEPAALDGRPIDAGYNLKISFALEGEGAPGARPSFVRDYRRAIAAIESGDREQAEERLGELEVGNLYEDAYLNVARYWYFKSWGDRHQRLAALRRAVAHEQEQKYLPEQVFRWALLTRFALEVDLQDFGAALDTARLLRSQNLTGEQTAALEATVAEIRTLASDDRSFAVTGYTGADTSWYITLLKRHFYIDQVEGEIAEIKLRCDRDYVLFRYDPTMEYQVSEQQGTCHMEVVGDPGTTFRLVQS
ncbi:MAG: TonB family protein [Gammaproteobacteria bacterium]|jgi:TonB family protein|nr:TonB family protein [Gammaproteobacteria bacterium]